MTSKSKPCLLYFLDSLFLRECLGRLTPGPDEELMIVSGLRHGQSVVPCAAFKPDYEHSSRTGVQVRGESSHRVLRMLSKCGHGCVAMIHSHPGKGIGAVEPSLIDIMAQERFERAGYEVITGIFSRDGYARFFSNRLQFRIKLYGSDVHWVGSNVLRLRM